jgi:flagellar hook-length control protein FliK
MLKKFLTKQVMKKQLAGMPPAQQEALLNAVEKDPKFFEDLAKQIEAATKGGKNQVAATMEVMMKPDIKKKFQELLVP